MSENERVLSVDEINEKLLPCPFCGGKSFYSERKYVECGNCGCKYEWEQLEYWDGSLVPEDYILDAWNKRVSEIQDNSPLSWEELKMMKGKPIWIEHKYFKIWKIIDEIDDVSMIDKNNNFRQFYFEDMGERWTAYRMERPEKQ